MQSYIRSNYLLKVFRCSYLGIFWGVSIISFTSDLLELNKLGKQTIEIFNQLKAVYNDQALSYATVARWVALFINGRESTEDDTR